MARIKYGYVYLGLGLLGLLGGFLYWHFWGCTDSCPIDSSWKLSMLRGGLVGLLLAAIFQPSRKKSETEA
ncbi:MAG: hypothetical protein U0176_08235 [Bacteroidia bacterium]